MRINDKMNKSLLETFWNKTNKTSNIININTTSTTHTTITSTTSKTMLQSTVRPVTIIQEGLNNELSESLNNVETLIIIIIIFMTIMVAFKIFKICKTGYKIHNEKVIKKHESTNTRV